jgi:hypothetical protein
MGFPFIKPLDDWMEEKLKRREKNQKLVALANPFVVLSSTAIVTNDSAKTQDGTIDGNKIKDILDGKSDKTIYTGCIISNQIDKQKVYSTGQTIVGYDFVGNPIKVLGETNRRVPQPIITSLEVNTDGANNSLKTASLKIKIFTLKQLEMFELFYLRPSMHLLVEFGSNEGVLTKKYTSASLDKEIIANKTWTEFLKDYNKNFSGKIDARQNYSKKIKDTDGDYDYVAGLVTNFKFLIADDLTYDVELEISSANTMMMWLPQTPAKQDSKTAQQNIIFDKFTNWTKKLEADLDINLGDDLKNEKWKDEFFNWQMIALKQDDTKASLNPYLSVRYILNLTNDQLGVETADSKISLNEFYEDSAKTKPIIPINTLESGIIISYSSDIIIPGKMPQFGVTEKKDKIVIKKTKDEKVEPILNKVNKYSFNLDSTAGIYDRDGKIIESTKERQYGNLLNIFVKYDVFLSMWKKSTHRADFFNQLISLINENLYGVCKLTLGLAVTNAQASNTILDSQLKLGQFDEDKFDKLYRFKVGVSDSIVKGFEFNFELSNLAQGQAAFSSISMIDSVLNPKDKNKVPELVKEDPSKTDGTKYSFTPEGYAKFDMSVFTNADNFMSVDRGAADITLESVEANMKKKLAMDKTGLNPTEAPKKGEATTEDKNEEESLNSKSVKFKFNASDTKETPKTLIYTDKGFLVNNIVSKNEQGKKSTSALTFLEITIILDGTSGINCGEVFKIDGVPEIYNMNGFFQVTNIKHQIENDGWKTIIEAGYRVSSKNG